jgi:cephalosporin hydroxylase
MEEPLVRDQSGREVPGPIHWKTDTEFDLEGVDFKCVLTDYGAHKTDADCVVLIKGRNAIERYQEILQDSPPSTVLEFGIFEGGSAVLLSLLYDLRKYVGVDQRAPVDGLDGFLAAHPVGRRISLHYRTPQDDAGALTEIAATEFGSEPIDLIIDDASHQYAPSRRSFEVAFPFLRPGGIYVIEDWGWGHWPNFSRWQDSPALSNLIFELSMVCAAHPELIQRAILFPSFAFFTKGHSPYSTQALDLAALVGERGRSLNRI